MISWMQTELRERCESNQSNVIGERGNWNNKSWCKMGQSSKHDAATMMPIWVRIEASKPQGAYGMFLASSALTVWIQPLP